MTVYTYTIYIHYMYIKYLYIYIVCFPPLLSYDKSFPIILKQNFDVYLFLR